MDSSPEAKDTRALALRLTGGALLAGLFLWRWLDFSDVWIDDAFITFRYGRNWAEGLGPVYNAGERVQGYTTFSWMALSALCFRLFAEAQALSVVRGVSFGLGLWVLWRAFDFPRPDGRRALRFGVLLLAAHPLHAVNSSDGLETPLFAALLLESARAAVAPLGRRSGALLGTLTAALALTRPDAIPFVLVWPALTLLFREGLREGRLREDRRPTELRPWLVAFLVCALGPLLIYTFGCIAYYGTPLPNTYVAKATGDVATRLATGAGTLAEMLGGHPFLRPLTLWSAIALAGLAIVKCSRAAPRWVAVLTIAVGSRVAFELWSGGAWMGIFRFLAPALPPLVVLADEGARKLPRPWALAGLAVLLAFGSVLDHGGHERLTRTRAAYGASLQRAHVALGLWLRERYPEDTRVAVGDAGAIPFYSRLPTIDLWGLNDATIARLPGEYGDKPETAAYALAREPTAFVLWSVVPHTRGFRGAQHFDRAIYESRDFQRRYRFVREFVFRPARSDRPGYYLAVFERSGAGSR